MEMPMTGRTHTDTTHRKHKTMVFWDVPRLPGPVFPVPGWLAGCVRQPCALLSISLLTPLPVLGHTLARVTLVDLRVRASEE